MSSNNFAFKRPRQMRRIKRKKGGQHQPGQKVFLKPSTLSGVFQSGSDSIPDNSMAPSGNPADQSENSESASSSDCFKTGSDTIPQNLNAPSLNTASHSETLKSSNSSILFQTHVVEGFGRPPHLEASLKKFIEAVSNKNPVQKIEDGEIGNQNQRDQQNVSTITLGDSQNPKDQQNNQTTILGNTQNPKDPQNIQTTTLGCSQNPIDPQNIQSNTMGDTQNPKDQQNIESNTLGDTENLKDLQNIQTNNLEDTQHSKPQKQSFYTYRTVDIQNPQKQVYVDAITLGDTQISRTQQSNEASLLIQSQNQKYQQNIQTSQLEPSNIIVKTEGKGKFPELVIFRGCNKKESGILFLKQCFKNSPYGPLCVEVTEFHGLYKATLSCGGEVLAEGKGQSKNLAQSAAVVMLFKELCKTNYVIEVKLNYIPRKRFPQHIVNYKSSYSNVFKVVCLKKPGGPPFPHPLSGPIDYVTSENDLWKYVEEHAKSASRADIFVLNIEKEQRKIPIDICRKHGMVARPLNNCSNRGVVASRVENTRELLEDLKACGGYNVKYLLNPPGSSMLDQSKIQVTSDSPGIPSFSTIKEEPFGDDEDNNVKIEAGNHQQNTPNQEEDVVISRWIKDNLVIMDYFDESGNLDTPYEILFKSVRDNAYLEEFIVQKNFDRITGEITGCAMIDKNVVGISKDFNNKIVKQNAAKNALENLRKCCCYIMVKKSYYELHDPSILSRKNGKKTNNLFRIVRPEELRNELALDMLLHKFKTSRFEDLFFLENLSEQLRNLVYEKAKLEQMPVHYCGKNSVCVSNRRRPLSLYKNLMSKKNNETMKYKLITPPGRFNKPGTAFSRMKKQQDLQGVFRHGMKYRQPSQEPCSTSSQSMPSDQVDRQTSDDRGSETRPQSDQSKFSGPAQRMEQPSKYRRDNKRPYNEGPGLTEGREAYSNRDSMQQSWKQDEGPHQQFQSWRERLSDFSRTVDRGVDFNRFNQEMNRNSYEYNNRSYDYGDNHRQEKTSDLQTESLRDNQYYNQKSCPQRGNEPGPSNSSLRDGDKDGLFCRRKNYLSFEGNESQLYSRRLDYVELNQKREQLQSEQSFNRDFVGRESNQRFEHPIINLSMQNMESQQNQNHSFHRDDNRSYENRLGNRDNRDSGGRESNQRFEQVINNYSRQNMESQLNQDQSFHIDNNRSYENRQGNQANRDSGGRESNQRFEQHNLSWQSMESQLNHDQLLRRDDIQSYENRLGNLDDRDSCGRESNQQFEQIINNYSRHGMESQQNRDQSFCRDDSRTYRYRLGNTDNTDSAFREIDRQTEQNWNRRDRDHSRDRGPVGRNQSHTTSVQSHHSSREAGPSQQQASHLWDKDSKQFYDQTPAQVKESRLDFSNLFDGVSPKEPSEPFAAVSSGNRKRKEKRKGHSFTKLARYGK